MKLLGMKRAVLQQNIKGLNRASLQQILYMMDLTELVYKKCNGFDRASFLLDINNYTKQVRMKI